jgi:phosphopentomutase
MARVIIALLDSFGIGYAHDAADFGDKGADTLGHIAAWFPKNLKDKNGKARYLHLPNLASMGLEKAHALSMQTELVHPLGACKLSKVLIPAQKKSAMVKIL